MSSVKLYANLTSGITLIFSLWMLVSSQNSLTAHSKSVSKDLFLRRPLGISHISEGWYVELLIYDINFLPLSCNILLLNLSFLLI